MAVDDDAILRLPEDLSWLPEMPETVPEIPPEEFACPTERELLEDMSQRSELPEDPSEQNALRGYGLGAGAQGSNQMNQMNSDSESVQTDVTPEAFAAVAQPVEAQPVEAQYSGVRPYRCPWEGCDYA